MSLTVFRQIGPYEIVERIGHGGIATVYLARDTRAEGFRVALKVVPNGPDANARETAEAEQRGAELQRRFLHASAFVPQVFEVGTAPGYLYIAMEYLDGEDLSAVIRNGPVEPTRAAHIAIQLCQFLEEIDEIDRRQTEAETASKLTLLHNDLKPSNVRIVSGDRVKVLDFGAAKTLSMSRRWTRNDFYSTPYLSPECLETGERDRQTDAWALGVMLYEMLAGAPPFHGDDTRRLEHRIRSRTPPATLEACPRALQAVVAKLLAPHPQSRYPEAQPIREDLERLLAGTTTTAEEEGWPERGADEPPTRRTSASAEERLRRDHDLADEVVEAPTRRLDPPAATVATRRSVVKAALRTPVWLRSFAILVVLVLVTNEGFVAARARRAAATVPMQEFAGFTSVWNQYQSLSGQSLLGGLGARPLGSALSRQALVLAERVADNYRTPAPTVREAQWQAAAAALERALTVEPNDSVLRGTLRYSQGQLHRINGEARKARRQIPQAQRDFSSAVTAFREAAALRPKWPDPFLGLARTFIYGIEDIDRGADAMKEAARLGHPTGDRETAQLADGYRKRGEALEKAAADLRGMPQEREFLVRARDAYRHALDLYTGIAAYADTPANIRMTQRHIDVLDRKLLESTGTWE
jgi:hypothetical protein